MSLYDSIFSVVLKSLWYFKFFQLLFFYENLAGVKDFKKGET